MSDLNDNKELIYKALQKSIHYPELLFSKKLPDPSKSRQHKKMSHVFTYR